MTLYRFLCPIKPYKSCRKSKTHNNNRPKSLSTEQTNDDNNNPHQNHHSNTASISNGLDTPYRYVLENYSALEGDELSVFYGDIVLYLYTDIVEDQSWSFVRCLRKNEEGYVPSKILSTQPNQLLNGMKKKLPSSRKGSIMNHAHSETNTNKILGHSYRTCHSSGEHAELRQPERLRVEQSTNFDLVNSLQSSCGCQTVQKYPNWSYNNLDFCKPHNTIEHNSKRFNYQVFTRTELGLYLVLYNFAAKEEDDLNVERGEFVTVLNKDDDNCFWVRRSDQAEGFVPANFICSYERIRPILDKINSTRTMKSFNRNECPTYINHDPDRDNSWTNQSSTDKHL